MDIEQLYSRLPVFLQNAAATAQGYRINRWRYGGDFERVLAEYVERASLPDAALRDYQGRRLAELLDGALQTPFWKERFDRYGINAKSGNPFEEIQKLPVLGKVEARASVGRILNPTIPRHELISRHTSGTTGSGMVFSGTRRSEHETWAVWWRYRLWHGITRDAWCGYFGGRSVVPVSQVRPPFWRTNYAGRQIMYSAYHINAKNAGAYLAHLRSTGVSWLHGYPSVLSLLASFAEDLSAGPFESIRIVTTGAESLSGAQRSQIGQAFGAQVAEHYGQAESVANISQCEAGSLHVDEDYSLVEFEPLSGLPGSYRIIGTNWVNPAFPLIRYDTGDVATLEEGRICPCGRTGRLVSAIDGRVEDYLTLPDGTRIGRLDHIFKDCVNIREAQIFQARDGRIVFRIVKGDNYGAGDEARLESEVRKRIGDAVDFDIDYCDEIARTATGKFRFVVSEMAGTD